jgi:hypothetical protein
MKYIKNYYICIYYNKPYYMPQNKFKLTITNNDQTIEKLFATREEVCTFLDIKVSTLYAIQRGTIKLSHQKQKVLEGVKIEKLEVQHSHNTSKKKNVPHNAINKEDYLNTLIAKI